MDALNKVPLFDQIHAVLWEKICSGEIAPKSRLKDIDWARRLRVSRTPVREAMRKMQQDGVLIPLQQGGYEVRTVNRSDLIDLYRCRGALEALAAEDAASACTSAAAATLQNLIEECDAAIDTGDLERVFTLNTEFHTAILEMSSNVHLKTLCGGLQRMILFYRKALLRLASTDEVDRNQYLHRLRAKQAHHRAILDAMKRRDGRAAGQLMQAHLRETVNDLLPALPANSEGAGSSIEAA
ncbi:GntR family transcriptional regulator [Microbacteriaceae bacterium K1510]|nr:GntR family transcriptional regulator [Microbacteriaceae bacterium K1510]